MNAAVIGVTAIWEDCGADWGRSWDHDLPWSWSWEEHLARSVPPERQWKYPRWWWW